MGVFMSNTRKTIFKGCATAIVTPFIEGKIDFVSFGKLIDRQVDGGAAAMVICGTTGEAATMSIYEQLSCIEFALKRVDGRIPIIAGTGSNCTKKAIELSKSASELGCDALLVVTPYYNKSTDEGLVRHFTEVADASVCPIMLYNVPSRTGVNIPISVYSKLSRHENIVGVKEASGNISSIALLFAECGEYYDIYSGNDDQILPILSLGGSGVISVVSNLLPARVQKLCDDYFSYDTHSAKKQQLDLCDLISVLFCEVNPIPVKYALALMGLCSDEMRLPLCQPSENSKEKIRITLKKYALI